jgi:hypothetical protein
MTRARPPPDDLRVGDLYGAQEARMAVNHETYKQLLRQVQDRIRARAAGEGRDLLWQVPPMVPGRPLFTTAHAANYVAEKLRRRGFSVDVAALAENAILVYVTWGTPTRTAARARARPSLDGPRPGPDRPQAPAAGLDDGPVTVAEATNRLERLKAFLRF